MRGPIDGGKGGKHGTCFPSCKKKSRPFEEKSHCHLHLEGGVKKKGGGGGGGGGGASRQRRQRRRQSRRIGSVFKKKVCETKERGRKSPKRSTFNVVKKKKKTFVSVIQRKREEVSVGATSRDDPPPRKSSLHQRRRKNGIATETLPYLGAVWKKKGGRGKGCDCSLVLITKEYGQGEKASLYREEKTPRS